MLTSWQEKLDYYLTPARQRMLFIVFLLLFALFLTYHINEPFIGTYSAFDGFFGIAARNWIHLGPVATDFGMMVPYGAELSSVREFAQGFYLNHPQLFIAPLAFIYWLFGVGNWQTRIFPIIFSLLAFIMFWKLTLRVFWKPWLTALSSLLYILFPIGIYYGRLVVQDPIVIFFILALFLTAVLFEQERKRKYLILMCVVTFFGGLADFQFFFAAAATFAYVAIKRSYPERGKALLLVAGVSAASLAVTIFQIGIITQINPLYYLFVLFSNRTGANPSLLNWTLLWGNFNLVNFTEAGLILAAIGAVLYFSKETKGRVLFAAMLLFPGLLNVLIFRKMSVFDQYWSLYLMPFIALMAAWGIGHIRRTWIVCAILILFMGSSLVYTGALFTYKPFVADDFTLVEHANALVPQSEPLCMGDAPPTYNLDFYLFPHSFDYFPCPDDDSYFLMRQPKSFLDQPPLIPWLFTSGVITNLQRTSFLAAFTIEAVKSFPSLEQKVRNTLARYEPRQGNTLFAERAQDAIDKYELQIIDCSTNFCLYRKQ